MPITVTRRDLGAPPPLRRAAAVSAWSCRHRASEVDNAAMNASCGTSTLPDHLHPLLPLLLPLQQLALAGDVTAVALASTSFRIARMVSRAITREPTAAWIGTSNCWRGISLELLSQGNPVAVGAVAMHDRAGRRRRLAVQQDVHLDQVGLLLADRLVIEAGVPLGPGLQLIEEVEDDLGQRQRVPQLDPVRGQVVHLPARRPGESGTGP